MLYSQTQPTKNRYFHWSLISTVQALKSTLTISQYITIIHKVKPHHKYRSQNLLLMVKTLLQWNPVSSRPLLQQTECRLSGWYRFRFVRLLYLRTWNPRSLVIQIAQQTQGWYNTPININICKMICWFQIYKQIPEVMLGNRWKFVFKYEENSGDKGCLTRPSYTRPAPLIKDGLFYDLSFCRLSHKKSW